MVPVRGFFPEDIVCKNSPWKFLASFLGLLAPFWEPVISFSELMDGFCHDCGPFRVPMGAFWALGASIWEFLDACSEPWDTSCDFSATFLYLRVAFLIPSPPQAHPYSSLKNIFLYFLVLAL